MSRIIFFIKKYLLPVSLFVIYEVFWLVVGLIFIFFFPNVFPKDAFPKIELSPWLPFDWIVTEFMFIFMVYIPVAGLMGYLLGGYILAPIFLFIHKKFIGRNLIYGIQEKPTPTRIKFFGKGFFPILFSIMLATNITAKYLTEGIEQLFFSDYLLEIRNFGDDLRNEYVNIVGLLITIPWTFGVSMFLFSSIWFLKNSGIIYTNEQKVKSISEPFIIRSVGGWFHTIIKGYAGIGVIVTYFTVIVDLVNSFLIDHEITSAIIALVLWILLLILLLLATIPGLIINEMIRDKSGAYVRRHGARLGIVQFAEIKLTFKKKILSEEELIPEKDLVLEPEYEVTKVFESSIDKFSTQDFESETPEEVHELSFKEEESPSESNIDETTDN